MQIIKERFTSVIHYNEMIKNWDLNYKLLSKNDFSAEIHMIYNDDFSIAKEKLTGKIEQKGKTEEGLIVFGIPVENSTLYWFDKKIESDTLVIFPKGNSYEAISDSTHVTYVISIKETLFFNTMKKLGVKKNVEFFNGKAQELVLTKKFSNRFIKLLDYFLNTNLKNPKKNSALINSISESLIEFLDNTTIRKFPSPVNKKDLAIKKAIHIIKKQSDSIFSIPQLCALVGVSERTLLSAFKEKYQVTPSEYIKAFRLNKVKREIYTSKTKSISEIAGKYHFWHMGQFAKDFKKQFGILPSEIVKNN